MGPIAAAAGGAFGGFLTGFFTAWYGPKRQHYFWVRQQYVGLCLKAYERVVDLSEEYAKVVYQDSGHTDSDFTMRLLSVTGDIKVLFGHTSAWQPFVDFDDVLSKLPPKPHTEFIKARDRSRSAFLKEMGIVRRAS
jgi:hypothetical protein